MDPYLLGDPGSILGARYLSLSPTPPSLEGVDLTLSQEAFLTANPSVLKELRELPKDERSDALKAKLTSLVESIEARPARKGPIDESQRLQKFEELFTIVAIQKGDEFFDPLVAQAQFDGEQIALLRVRETRTAEGGVAYSVTTPDQSMEKTVLQNSLSVDQRERLDKRIFTAKLSYEGLKNATVQKGESLFNLLASETATEFPHIGEISFFSVREIGKEKRQGKEAKTNPRYEQAGESSRATSETTPLLPLTSGYYAVTPFMGTREGEKEEFRKDYFSSNLQEGLDGRVQQFKDKKSSLWLTEGADVAIRLSNNTIAEIPYDEAASPHLWLSQTAQPTSRSMWNLFDAREPFNVDYFKERFAPVTIREGKLIFQEGFVVQSNFDTGMQDAKRMLGRAQGWELARTSKIQDYGEALLGFVKCNGMDVEGEQKKDIPALLAKAVKGLVSVDSPPVPDAIVQAGGTDPRKLQSDYCRKAVKSLCPRWPSEPIERSNLTDGDADLLRNIFGRMQRNNADPEQTEAALHALGPSPSRFAALKNVVMSACCYRMARSDSERSSRSSSRRGSSGGRM